MSRARQTTDVTCDVTHDVASDDSAVLASVPGELDDLTERLREGLGAAEDQDVWQRKQGGADGAARGTATLTRRPRAARAATVGGTPREGYDLSSGGSEREEEPLPRLSLQGAAAPSCTSRSDELLDCGGVRGDALRADALGGAALRGDVLGDPRPRTLSEKPAAHGSEASGLQRGASTTATVKNFVQGFEKLKDLSYTNRNSHSPSDLFPAHRSALAGPAASGAASQSPGAKGASSPPHGSLGFHFSGGDKTGAKGKDGRYLSLNGYRTETPTPSRLPDFLQSGQKSGFQTKFFNGSKTADSKATREADNKNRIATSLASKGLPDAKYSLQSQRSAVDGTVQTGSASPTGSAFQGAGRAPPQLTRWTMTKHGRDLYKTNSLDSTEPPSRLASFAPGGLSRAASLSKFDDDDEYLCSPPTAAASLSDESGAAGRYGRASGDPSGAAGRPSYRPLNGGIVCVRESGLSPSGVQGGVNGAGSGSASPAFFRAMFGAGRGGGGGGGYQSQYATLRLPTGPGRAKTPVPQLSDMSIKNQRILAEYSPASPTSPSYRLAEDIQATEIRRLRQDLQWAKEQVSLLTTRLSNNANVVEAFDRSLSNMSQRLHDLTATSQSKNSELSELLDTVESLRRQNRGQSGTPQNKCIGDASTCRGVGQEWISRQVSSDSVTSLTSSATSVCSGPADPPPTPEGTDHFSRKNSVKNWLRSSFGKAFSRKKQASKPQVGGEGSAGSQVPHANSMPSISYGSPDAVSLSSGCEEPSAYYRPLQDLQACHAAPSYFNHPFLSSSATSIQLSPVSSTARALDERLQGAPSGMSSSVSSGVTSSVPSSVAYSRPGTALSHKRSESLDPKLKLTAPAGISALMKERLDKDAHKIIVSVALSPETFLSSQNQARVSSVVIGSINVGSRTSWDALDGMVRRVFQEHLIRLDPNTSLGLNGESVFSYKVGEVIRTKGSPTPELLPIGYLIGEVNQITMNLKGNPEKSVDLLAFDILIPKSVIQRLLKLLLEHRRIILSGSTGTGKTYLAQRLAECLVARSGSEVTSDSIAVFRVDSQSSRELRQYLSNMAAQCERMPGQRGEPGVVILDNLHHVSSLSDVFSGFLDTNYHNSPYIIGTMNQASCSTTDLQLHHNFRWVLYANHIEPVRTFLGRFLRRQLVPVEVTSGLGMNLDLIKVVEWLPKVWQHVNKFLETHSSCDITIGPRLFLSCPMDVARAQVWFNDLWNYSIVPYLLEAVREGIQTYGCRAPWEDLADWVIDSYPWGAKQTHRPALLRLRPEDVGYDSKAAPGAGGMEAPRGGPTAAPCSASADRPPEAESTLMDILTRLQEAAAHSDSDTNSTDGHSQVDRREGRHSVTPSLSDTAGGSPPCRTTIL